MGLSASARRWALVALLVYATLLTVALLAPTSGTQSSMAGWVRDLGTQLGLSTRLATQGRAEFLCNALIVAPISAAGSLLWPRTTWRDWTAYAFVLACTVEGLQGLALPERTASQTDVVANTLGGLLGALTVLVVRRAIGVSRRRTAAGTPRTTPARPRPRPGPRS